MILTTSSGSSAKPPGRTTKACEYLMKHVGYYLDADGKPKVAGTFDSDDEALRVAQRQEDHVRERRTGTPPATKATITIEEFARKRFLPRIEITPKAKQTYKS
jgi:hypothetical protein